jgi:hypothetical protein
MARKKIDRSFAERHFAAREKLLSATRKNFEDFEEGTGRIQEKIWSLLREYQSLCQSFDTRRTQVIGDAVASEPSLQAAVLNDPSFLHRIPEGHCAIWDSPRNLGLELSFVPSKNFSWDGTPSINPGPATLDSSLKIPSQLQACVETRDNTICPVGLPTATTSKKSRQRYVSLLVICISYLL